MENGKCFFFLPAAMSLSTLVVAQGFFEMWIADRQQRPALEPPDEECQPYPSQTYRGGQIHPVHRERLAVESRRNQPEKIDETHDDYRGRQAGKETCAALQIARQEQEKRQRKVEENQNQSYPLPAPVQPARVPGDLLREVAGPDDQILRE